MLDIGKLFKDPAFKFKREEFVHPSIITSVGIERCLYYISDFQVNYAMLLREVLQAPVIINTWHYKKPGPGYYVGRGTRPRSYKPAGGGELSMHYFASALDVSSPYTRHSRFSRQFWQTRKDSGLLVLLPSRTSTLRLDGCMGTVEG